MKYVEELECGDTFLYQNQIYLLTSDFKSNGSRLCYSLKNGQSLWLKNDTMIDHNPVYLLDSENTIIAVKNTKNQNVVTKI